MNQETQKWLFRGLEIQEQEKSEENMAHDAEVFWLGGFEKELKKMILEEYQILTEAMVRNQKDITEQQRNQILVSSSVIRGLERVKEWFDDKINLSLSRFEKENE